MAAARRFNFGRVPGSPRRTAKRMVVVRPPGVWFFAVTFKNLIKIFLRFFLRRKGADVRWGGRDKQATACLRVYPADAEANKARAKAAGRLPADVVAAMVKD